MSATSIDLSQIKTDALSAASTFRTLIGLGDSDTPTFKAATLSAGTLNGTVLDVSQTWGGTGTYTGLRYNVTDSGPANAASLLMDLQVGGSSRFKITKAGRLNISGGGGSNSPTDVDIGYAGVTNYGIMLSNGVRCVVNGVVQTWSSPSGLQVNGAVAWTDAGAVGNITTQLVQDAFYVLALRNGTNANTFRIYNTYTDANNWERAKIAWSSNVLQIGTEGLGTGASNPRAMEFQTAGTTRLTIASTGAISTSVKFQAYQYLECRGDGSSSSIQLLNNSQSLISIISGIESGGAVITGSLANDLAFRGGGRFIFGPSSGATFIVANNGDITAKAATLSGSLDLTIRTVTYGATMAIDAALGNKIAITLAGNGTISNPTNAVDGRVLVFRLRQDATGSRIPVWDTKYSFVGDLSTVTLSTAANKIDRVAFEYDSTDDKWYCISFIKGS